ncbi:MAG TPA: CoA transferase [Alphaproteobacteria bacterium]|nr:CoA transferase [Alphaproteobacteria bacterium]
MEYEVKQYDPAGSAPLAGVRVIDLSRLVAGNALTHVLADYGAEVVKVERPGLGDDLRNWTVDGISAYWKVYGRNKKSVTLNMRSEQGRALLLQLVETAQLLVENFLPGTLEDWGLGPEVLLKRNPKLVVVRISGFGQDGPDRHKPGYGTLVEARSGFAALNGFPDRPPLLPPLALADMVAGLYGVGAALIALRNVEVSGGRGQVIDLPLFDPLFSIIGPEPAVHQITGKPTPRQGNRASHTAPRNIYRCSDGNYVALSASMQSMAERLFRAIGRADMIDDPRFATNTARVENNEALDRIVGDFMAARTQAENLAFFEEAGVTVGPVNDATRLRHDAMVNAREVLVRYADPEMGELPMHNVAARLSETPGSIRSPAPALGQHNAEVFGALGVDEAGLRRLQDEGVI